MSSKKNQHISALSLIAALLCLLGILITSLVGLLLSAKESSSINWIIFVMIGVVPMLPSYVYVLLGRVRNRNGDKIIIGFSILQAVSAILFPPLAVLNGILVLYFWFAGPQIIKLKRKHFG